MNDHKIRWLGKAQEVTAMHYACAPRQLLCATFDSASALADVYAIQGWLHVSHVTPGTNS